MIAQNYILYALPFTLTYVILYVIARKIKNPTLSFLSVIVFVTVKNIIYAAFFTTIIADLIGLLLILLVSKINISWIRYIIIVITILFHILLLDFSVAMLTFNILETLIAYIATGFLTYIYAPLSIILIIIIDGISYITEPLDEP